MAETVAIHPLQHVLLVDNDRAQTDHIRAELAERSDLQVHVVPDVVKAIRFLAKRDGFIHAPTPDLVLLDLALPYYPGTALLQERRRRPSWSGIPVIVLSDSHDDALSCVSLGANAHLVKPTVSSEWRPLLGDLLARHLPLPTAP